MAQKRIHDIKDAVKAYVADFLHEFARNSMKNILTTIHMTL